MSTLQDAVYAIRAVLPQIGSPDVDDYNISYLTSSEICQRLHKASKQLALSKPEQLKQEAAKLNLTVFFNYTSDVASAVHGRVVNSSRIAMH
jgi:hypothetical protein